MVSIAAFSKESGKIVSMTIVMCGAQRRIVGVFSNSASCGSKGLNPGCQTWRQKHLAPSCMKCLCFYREKHLDLCKHDGFVFCLLTWNTANLHWYYLQDVQ